MLKKPTAPLPQVLLLDGRNADDELRAALIYPGKLPKIYPSLGQAVAVMRDGMSA